MDLIAAITWFITICLGLFLLAIWLVEYDRDAHGDAASRLPLPVLSGHALLAVIGAPVWLVYILTGERRLALLATLILAGVAVLGLTMMIRWLGVYRAYRGSAIPAAPVAAVAPVTTGTAFRRSSPAPALPPRTAIPPERNFPIAVVACHGLFAVVTVVLVLLSAFDVFGP
jgi:hypothetical protein